MHEGHISSSTPSPLPHHDFDLQHLCKNNKLRTKQSPDSFTTNVVQDTNSSWCTTPLSANGGLFLSVLLQTDIN